jgi:tetratricopeptide (TPR) repeat protein
VQRIGHYQLLQELGRGGMGTVYRALDVQAQREVAIKLLQVASPRARQRFLTEARSLAQLRHPYVVSVHSIGEHRGQPYLVLDFVEGSSLSETLAQCGPLPIDRVVSIGAKLADALQHAHDKGVLHRDVKPENVLMSQDGEPQLTDFGLARAVTSSGGLTQEGSFLGTPGYWPPEQARGALDAIGPRADVYGLGATLYALLTGRPPLLRSTLPETIEATLEEAPVPPHQLRSEVDRALERIVLTCLAKTPEQRYASASDLADALRAREAAGAAPSRKPWLVAAGILALLAAAGGALAARSRPSQRPPAAASPRPSRVAAAPAAASRAVFDEPEAVPLTEASIAAELEQVRALYDAEQVDEAIRRAGVLRTQAPAGSLQLPAIHEELARGHAVRAIEHRRAGRLTKALGDAERAVEIDPSYAQGHRELGFALLEQGKDDPARSAFERALACWSRDGGSWVGLSAIEERAESWAAAADHLAHALELNLEPTREALGKLATLQAKAGRPADAEQSLTRALALTPGTPKTTIPLLLDRARLRARAGDGEGAKADYQRVIDANPNHGVAYNRRGQLRVSLGEVEGGLADMQRATELLPDWKSGYTRLQQALVELERWDEALSTVDRALEHLPRDHRLHSVRAGVFESKLDFERQVAALSEAIALTPLGATSLASDLSMRGHVRCLLGLEGGDEDLARAVEVASALDVRARALQLQAVRALELDQHETALALSERAAQLDPSPYQHILKGFVHLALGQEPQAAESMRQAYALDVSSQIPLYFLHALGHAEEAAPDLERVASLAPRDGRAGWHATLASYYLGRATLDEVLERAGRADSPESAQRLRCDAHFYIALLHRRRDPALARAHFERCVETRVLTYFEWVVARLLLRR